MTRAVIAAYACSPFHFANNGARWFASALTHLWAAQVIAGLVARSGLDRR